MRFLTPLLLSIILSGCGLVVGSLQLPGGAQALVPNEPGASTLAPTPDVPHYFYFTGADSRVRRVNSTDGTISTIAGNGAFTNPNLATTQFVPLGVFFDSSNNFFVVDHDYHLIRFVPAASGTFLGKSVTAGNAYVIAGSGVTGNSPDGTAAIDISFGYIAAVAVDDSSNVYVSDSNNSTVMVIAQADGVIDGQAVSAGKNTTLISGMQIAQLGVDHQKNLFYSLLSTPSRIYMKAAVSGMVLGQTVVAGNTYTITGNGTGGYTGDGGIATSAQINGAMSFKFDSAGNFYFADSNNHAVRVIANVTGSIFGQAATAGNIYSVIGDGSSGNSGDGAIATSGKLNYPNDIALDPAGNLLIADGSDYKVRLVAKTTGTLYGVAATANFVYKIAGTGSTGYSGDGGSPLVAQFGTPQSVAVDGYGNFVISDSSNSNLRLVAGVTGTVLGRSVVQNNIYSLTPQVPPGEPAMYYGDGASALNSQFSYSPRAITRDAAGNFFIADAGNHVVRMIAAVTGTVFGQAVIAGNVYTVAGTGVSGFATNGTDPLTSQLQFPEGVAFDANGNLFISDYFFVYVIAAQNGTVFGQAVTANRIYRAIGNGGTGTAGDGGPPNAAEMNTAGNIVFDKAGNLYLADVGNFRVRMVAAVTGTLLGQAVTANRIYSVTNSSLSLFGEGGVAVDDDGNLFIGGGLNCNVIAIPAANGTLFGQSVTAGVATTIAGTGSCGITGEGGLATSAEVLFATDIAFDPAGNLFINSGSNSGNLAGIRVVAKQDGVILGRTVQANHIYTLVGNGAMGHTGDGGNVANTFLAPTYAFFFDP